MELSSFGFVVAAFPDEKGADEGLKQIRANEILKVNVKDVAIVEKGMDNKLHIKETGDMAGGKGAAIGATIGTVLGLITGPGAILTGAIGATIGGLAAKLHDSGIKNDRLKAFGDQLEPGTSMVIAIFQGGDSELVGQVLTSAGGKIITDNIDPDLLKDVDYSEEVDNTAELLVKRDIDTATWIETQDKLPY